VDEDEDSAEIPVAPVPRATPLPRRAPAPAAPLRQPTRSATMPPRRPAPAGRGATVQRSGSGSSSGRGWLVPVLAGAGALVLLVVVLLVTGVIGGSDNSTPAPNTTSTATPDSTAGGGGSGEQLTPASTKVAVLNGTTIPGLASREKDTLTEAGFSEIQTGNNTDQQRAESAVLYGTKPGARQQARSVARRLDIANVERQDEDTRTLANGADVVVILGQDKAP
jgi:LytR cell envelope-related transcriptional attenuator